MPGGRAISGAGLGRAACFAEEVTAMAVKDPVRGKTIRWSYEDGPTKGTTFEHVFGTDGTVTYRMLGEARTKSGNGSAKTRTKDEGRAAGQGRPSYEVAEVGPGVWAVSYLA